MSRGPRLRRPTALVAWVPWSENHRELFDLAPESWRPPSKVRVTRSAKGLTCTAHFTREDGVVAFLTTRAEYENGEWWFGDRSMRIKLGRPASKGRRS